MKLDNRKRRKPQLALLLQSGKRTAALGAREGLATFFLAGRAELSLRLLPSERGVRLKNAPEFQTHFSFCYG
jgi:hypothetical protein